MGRERKAFSTSSVTLFCLFCFVSDVVLIFVIIILSQTPVAGKNSNKRAYKKKNGNTRTEERGWRKTKKKKVTKRKKLFPRLQRVRQPVHGLVQALPFGGGRFEDLERSVLERLEAERLVHLGYAHAALHVLFVREHHQDRARQFVLLFGESEKKKQRNCED